MKLEKCVTGTDINPITLLRADVRVSNFDVKKVGKYLKELERQWYTLTPDIPCIKNIKYWFKGYVINDVGKVRQFLKTIDDEKFF